MTGYLPALVLLVLLFTGLLAWTVALLAGLIFLVRAVVAGWQAAVAAAVRRT
ncbi:hypothetical protein ACGFZK_32620 [Streptomyces sp. NPDC048257]|uniref:hypothetical protein n=1 Tax=Streptomyces sp. NPDC048257 TaxID=3365526 RepID=UPI00371C7C5C